MVLRRASCWVWCSPSFFHILYLRITFQFQLNAVFSSPTIYFYNLEQSMNAARILKQSFKFNQCIYNCVPMKVALKSREWFRFVAGTRHKMNISMRINISVSLISFFYHFRYTQGYDHNLTFLTIKVCTPTQSGPFTSSTRT